MTDLSLQAQAVMDHFLADVEISLEHDIAAALRELADHVAPSDLQEPRNNLPMAIECKRIREEILFIAHELEDHQ
jgi:hypothetical protein